MTMNRVRALALALPLGAVALVGGSVAFAQSGGDAFAQSGGDAPTPAPQTTPAPANPGAPATPKAGKEDCPEKGGASGSTSGTSTRHQHRGGSIASAQY